jgi:hypothetical protein
MTLHTKIERREEKRGKLMMKRYATPPLDLENIGLVGPLLKSMVVLA